jgi:hypothetical protein
MNGTARILLPLVVLGSAFASLAACEDEQPEGAPTPTATSDTALSPTAAATATPSPTSDMLSQIVVLASPGGTELDEGGYYVYSSVAVEVWETGASSPMHEYTIEGPLSSGAAVWLSGHELFVHRPDRLDLHDFDGDYVETLVEAEPGKRLLGAALSYDGRHLAYVETADGELTTESIADTRLVIKQVAWPDTGIELGETIVELPQSDPRLESGVWGQLNDVFWSANSAYVIVRAITHGDSPPPFIAVHLDGEVFVPTASAETQIGTEVDPFGRAAVTGFQYLGSGCSPTVDKDGNRVAYGLGWVDLASGELLNSSRVEQPPYAALWAPDGSEMMFAAADCETDTETPGQAWYRWTAENGPARVTDPVAVYRHWFGERAVLIQQADGDILPPHRNPWGYLLSRHAEDGHFLFGDAALPAFPSRQQVWLLGQVK